jgi:cell division septum initiation protein DivIVA
MSTIRRLNLFAIVEALLTLAALTLVAITVGSQLGPLLGLTGKAGLLAGWSIALVYDALWIGALRMSEAAIRQRSRVGMTVMLGLSTAAVGVSTGTLLVLGHAKVFAFVPLAAALFMALRIFAAHVLADDDTATTIAAQDAADRRARALARADARHLRTTAVTDVVTETAGHLGEMARQIARAETLTKAEEKIAKARAKAEERLREADKKHGELAAAFAARPLILTVTPTGTPVLPTGTDRPATAPAAIEKPAPQAAPATVAPTPVTDTGTQASTPTGPADDTTDTSPAHPVTLADLATVTGVPTPVPGEPLTDEQLDVVLRHLRYTDDPPRSYRQARADFRDRGFVGSEERVRRVWGALMSHEETTPAGD